MEKLIKLADNLDIAGLYKHADQVDKLIKIISYDEPKLDPAEEAALSSLNKITNRQLDELSDADKKNLIEQITHLTEGLVQKMGPKDRPAKNPFA